MINKMNPLYICIRSLVDHSKCFTVNPLPLTHASQHFLYEKGQFLGFRRPLYPHSSPSEPFFRRSTMHKVDGLFFSGPVANACQRKTRTKHFFCWGKWLVANVLPIKSSILFNATNWASLGTLLSRFLFHPKCKCRILHPFPHRQGHFMITHIS